MSQRNNCALLNDNTNSDGSNKRKAAFLSNKDVFVLWLSLLAMCILPHFKCIAFRTQVTSMTTIYLLVGLAGIIGLSAQIEYTRYRRVFYHATVVVASK